MLLTGAMHVTAQSELYPQHFDLEQVTLTDGPFRTALITNSKTLLQYDADRLMTPFVREAGLAKTTDTKSKYYNWLSKHPTFRNWGDSGWSLEGHVGGHYISALALSYASLQGDDSQKTLVNQLKQRLDYCLNIMKDCQDAYNGNTAGMEGFIGGQPITQIWTAMYANNISPYKQYGGWVPFYCQHKVLAGLRDAYIYAHSEQAKEMFRTAAMHQHHLSVSGGSKDAHYMLSAQYMDQEGIMKNTSNRRFNFRSNIDAKLGIVKVGLNLSGSRQDIQEPVNSVTGEGLMRALTWFTRPSVPVRYANGEYGCVDGNNAIGASVFKNPIQDMYYGHKTNDHYRFDGQIFGEIDLYKGLKFRSSLSYKYYNNETSTYSPRTDAKYNAEGDILNPAGTQNTLVDYHWLETSYMNENILTYANRFGEHSINVLLGHSIQSSRWDSNSASRQGFPTDNIYELDGGSQNDHVSGSAEQTRLQSFFGRINYNYADRYLAEFNVRHDGSSRLPSNNRYATFPSVSAAWIISNEAFLQGINWLSMLKLRASWGKLGNQEIGNYAYTETLSAQGSYFLGDSKYIGMKTSKIANENIKWETTTVTDFGFDASFFHGRLTTTFDWYNKVTSDILLQLPMPGIFLGSLGAPYQNAGKVRNRGWEFAANYQDRHGDWQWQAGFSLAGVKNEIVDMNGQESISNSTINREGEPIASYYALKAIGIYRTEADLKRTNSAGEVIKQNGHEPVLGDIMYDDFNDDGNINDDDRQIIGNPFPKLQYSFTLGASYKNFDLTTFWQGIAGLDRFNWDETTISNGGNKTSRWLDRYSAENVNGKMPRMGGEFNNAYSSFWLTSGDYLRLKSLEMGYTFRNNALLAKAGIQSLRLYISGSNLLTFTSLDDYDPEKLGSDSRNDVHPNVKAYSFGINVKF